MSFTAAAGFTNMCLVLAHDEIVTIQVGERCFTTNKSTLTEESSYFASLLSGRWIYQRAENGAPFIDADSTLFDHILRYLRRGVFPLFYNRAHGFDEGLYVLLMHEADFFGIEKLKDWIASKKYLQAVAVEQTADIVEGREDDSLLSNYSHIPDANIEKLYFPTWKDVQVYRCPRDIGLHRGNPRRCGKDCAKARVDGEPEFETASVLHTLVITKKIVIKHGVMT